jgi:ubiquinone biosynthesis protein UbiJ
MAAAPSSNNPGSVFDAFKPLAGRALETALNRILALDPDTQAALQELDGRRVQLTLDAPPLALQLTVSSGRFVVGPVPRDVDDEPDLAVRSTLSGLLSQLPFLKSDAGTPKVGKLRIAGDAELARQLQKLAEGFDPDWTKPFADVFGDVIGVQIANALRGALRFGRDSAGKFARNSAEFLTEESRDVPARDELDAFHDDVDALRDRVERLAAKVAGFDRVISDRVTPNSPKNPPSGKAPE